METVNSIQKLLNQGKDPKEVFTYVEDKNENNILCVCLHNEMWNLLKIPENKLYVLNGIIEYLNSKMVLQKLKMIGMNGIY